MIGVVVVHYENPLGLDRVLSALEGTPDLRVVVADDGSHAPPDPGVRPYPVEVVRQENRGFRAAAARNLGAHRILHSSDQAAPLVGKSRCDVLLFIDGDTIPAPGYVDAMAHRLRAVAATAPDRRALVVGRRRYADFSGLDADGVHQFLAAPQDSRILPDTDWLAAGYRDTADLAEATDTSYRFVISAVLGITPELFAATDGFAEDFIGYGGEDWEFAYRAWLAGAQMAHVRQALAWHEGPDAAVRDAQTPSSDDAPPDDVTRRRNAETLRTARHITVPGARDPGLIWEYPDIVIEMDDTDLHPADVLLSCGDLLRGADARIWLRHGGMIRAGLWPSSDPRIAVGEPPAASLARARYRVNVTQPVRLTVPLPELCADAPRRHPGLTLRATRELARGTPAPPLSPDARIRAPHPDHRIDAAWGWRTAIDLPPASPDPKDHR